MPSGAKTTDLPQQERIQRYLDDPGAFADLLRTDETRDAFFERISPGTLRRLLKAPALLDILAADAGLTKLLLARAEVREVLLDDANYLMRIAGDARVREYILATPALLQTLIADDRSREILLEDTNFLRRLIGDERSLEYLLEQPALLKRLLADDRTREVLFADANLRRRIAGDERTLDTIAGDDSLTKRILGDERVRETLLDNRAFLKKIAGDRRTLQHILGDPKLIEQLLADDRAAKALTQNRAFRERIIRDPRLFAEILSDQDSLAAILRDGGPGAAIREIPALLKDYVVGNALEIVTRDRGATRKLIQHEHLLKDADLADRMAANTNLLRVWRGLRPFLPDRLAGDAPFAELQSRIRHPDDVRLAVLSMLCRDNQLDLQGATLEFPQVAALWILIEEILINEEYYFPCEHASPVIVDAGSNFGLSLYYFKHFYPDAQITGFEPMPELCEIARRNCKENGLTNIEIHQAALTDRDGSETLFAPDLDSLGASMTRHDESAAGRTVEVETRRLSPFLASPVDFLKLDIEGAEDLVLEECSNLLGNVHHLFCEYHQGPGRPSGRMARILQILEQNGFDVVVGKSRSNQTRTGNRPLVHAQQRYSGCIWGTNRNPPKH